MILRSRFAYSTSSTTTGVRQVIGRRHPAAEKATCSSARQPGEAYTPKEELKVLKLLVQVVGRHFSLD